MLGVMYICAWLKGKPFLCLLPAFPLQISVTVCSFLLDTYIAQLNFVCHNSLPLSHMELNTRSYCYMYLQGHTKHRQEGGIIAFIIALKILLQTVAQVSSPHCWDDKTLVHSILQHQPWWGQEQVKLELCILAFQHFFKVNHSTVSSRYN